MMSSLNVVCAKWGNIYGADHVNRLYAGVLRNSTQHVNFFCVTDDSSDVDSAITCIELKKFAFQDALTRAQRSAIKKNGAYRKIAMFEPGLLPVKGAVLAFDLDVVITGPIDALASFAPGHVAMPSPFAFSHKRPTLGEGSVIKFEPEHHGFLFTDIATSTALMVQESHGSEQSYTSGRADAHGLFSPFPKEWVVSFKHHCRPTRPMNAFIAPKKPETARVVCFHGRPNIQEAIDGFKSDFLHKTKPAPWIAQNWKEL